MAGDGQRTESPALLLVYGEERRTGLSKAGVGGWLMLVGGGGGGDRTR